MTEKKPRLPKGDMFMPDTTIKDMRGTYKKEKNAGAALRLLACIKRKEGHTLRYIGRAINCRFETVGAWLRRMHRLGLKGRYHDKHPGATCKLTPEQLVELKEDLVSGPVKCGFDSGMWTAPMVIIHVRNKFGIQYKSSGMGFLLHRLGFSWRKARPRHPKAASPEQTEEFKKKLHTWQTNMPARDMSS